MDFTLITTSFNDALHIEQYVRQIQTQTSKPVELIIVDGGSKDTTVQIAETLTRIVTDFQIRVISGMGRLNIAEGINMGIKSCRTDFIAIGVIGNSYNETFFAELIDYQRNGNYDIVYGPIVGIDKTSFAKTFNIAFINSNRGWDFGIASNRGVLINRRVFDQCGFFVESFIYAGEDTEFFKRVKRFNFRTGYAPKAILYWQTPTNWNEYIKKMKVNAIADLQFEPGLSLLRNIAIRLSVIIVALTMILTGAIGHILLVALFVCFLAAMAVRIKSLSILALLLRFHFFFLPAIYYIKNYKVFKDKRISGY